MYTITALIIGIPNKINIAMKTANHSPPTLKTEAPRYEKTKA